VISTSAQIRAELVRLLDRVLEQIDDDSHPLDDIHHLAVAARFPGERTSHQRDAIAAAFVQLDAKVLARDLNQDLHWEARVSEIYAQSAALDHGLPGAIVARPEFGRPGHVMFLSELREGDREAIVASFVENIRNDDDYPWSSEVVLVLGYSGIFRIGDGPASCPAMGVAAASEAPSATAMCSSGSRISWCPVISSPRPECIVGRWTTFMRGR
jgi:hypothetical protein